MILLIWFVKLFLVRFCQAFFILFIHSSFMWTPLRNAVFTLLFSRETLCQMTICLLGIQNRTFLFPRIMNKTYRSLFQLKKSSFKLNPKSFTPVIIILNELVKCFSDISYSMKPGTTVVLKQKEIKYDVLESMDID